MFGYEPLKDREIRLITFLNDSGLNCTCSNHLLDENLKYFALSYTWGKAAYRKGRSLDDVYQITLNNQVVTVQQNLHDALRQLGQFVYGRDTRLWVDFICIDQANAAETAQQVRLMTEIYERAGAIYAWLGLPFDEEETRLGVALMESFHHYLRDGLQANNDDIHVVAAAITTDTVGFPRDDQPEHRKAWDGITELLNQRYWERTWIYQEATAPGNIWFCCGSHVFNDTLLSATVYFGSIFDDLPGFPQNFARASNSQSDAFRLSSARTRREKGATRTLLSLMLELRTTKSLDPRDKLFAPLGLAHDVAEHDGISLVVDYTRPVLGVYTDVTRFMIEKYGLSILSYVFTAAPEASHHYLRDELTPALPSWVVDWRRGIAIRPLDPSDQEDRSTHYYNAWPGLDQYPPLIQVQDTILLVNGSIIDEVTMMTSIWDDEHTSHDVPRGWKRTLQDALSTLNDETFNRLLVADVKQHTVDDVEIYHRGGSIDWHLLDALPSALGTVQRRLRELLVVRLHAVCRARRAGCTALQKVAIFPAAARAGDQVAAIHGSSTAHIIRPIADQLNHYRYIGECYVDGVMDGQAINPQVRSQDMRLIKLV